MNYSTIFFGKNLFDLTYQDVSEYFNTVREETIYLEFKSYVDNGKYSDKVEAIKKAICGMLNSEGGIVIWGAPLEIKDEHGNTTATGDLTPFVSKLDKDRLINTTSSSIIPLPIGIKVHQLQSSDSKSIFIFEIPKSITRPHQFSNYYFIRLDGQTRIAPHYLISALFKSVDFPDLRGHVRLKKLSTDGNNFILSFKRLLINRSEYINEINPQWRLITYPGTLRVGTSVVNSPYPETQTLLSHGTPFISSFQVIIPSNLAQVEIDIILQFGGEKSPMKMSKYTYKLNSSLSIGDIADESSFLVSKSENELPSMSSKSSYEETIENLLK